jgi:L-asparaginase II
VHCGAIPELGLGFAVKCDDGAGRAADVVTAALIAKFLPDNGQVNPVVAELRHPVLKNWNGYEVGQMRPAAALA